MKRSDVAIAAVSEGYQTEILPVATFCDRVGS